MLIKVWMRTNLAKWGNSMAVRIPKNYIDQLGVGQDGEVEITLEKDRIVLKKPQYKLSELLKKVKTENMHPETNTGDSVGGELL